MDLVKTIIGNINLDKDRLIAYGFNNDLKILTYKMILMDNLELRLSYDTSLNLKVWDLEINEEYIGYKLSGKGAYGSMVESEIEKILIEIKEFASGGIKYKYTQTVRIDSYMSEVYGKCEHPFSSYPGVGAYKESGNNKWYALIMSVSFNKLDNTMSDDEVEIINVKVDKTKLKSLLKIKGIYPAYHMNKANWVSIVLNDSVDDVKIIMLINDSYDLVQSNINNKKYYRRKF